MTYPSSLSSCRFCQRSSPIPIEEPKYAASLIPSTHTNISHHCRSASTTFDRKLPSTISSRLRLVKRLEGSSDTIDRSLVTEFDSCVGSHMLKRWQQLAEPRLSSCLQSIPGVYTRAEILHNVQEENEEDLVTPENDCEGWGKQMPFVYDSH